jgi:hypothetical protein
MAECAYLILTRVLSWLALLARTEAAKNVGQTPPGVGRGLINEYERAA